MRVLIAGALALLAAGCIPALRNGGGGFSDKPAATSCYEPDGYGGGRFVNRKGPTCSRSS